VIRGGPDQPNIGPVLHFVGGMMVIPILTLLLLICSFFAKVRGGVKWALLLLLTVFVQVMLGGFAFELPALGLLHGANAFILLTLALIAARAASRTAGRIPEPAETAESPAVEQATVQGP
jgi:heme A synthase